MRLNIHSRLFKIVLIMMIMGWGANYAQVNRQSIESLLEENSFTYGLHNRRTELMGNSCSIYGLVLGFPHSTRMKHMLTLNSTVFWIGENPEVQLNYLGFAEEYAFFTRPKLEFVLYGHIGIGTTRFQSLSNLGEPELSRQLAAPLELGVHASYRINSWMKFKTGIGHRTDLSAADIPLNAPYYKVGLAINIWELKKAWDTEYKSKYIRKN